MSEFNDRLQSALGDRYRVERELGGGGMSRVFLAEEVRLGRRVVIKVLPPQASAAIEGGRFEREIQVAASFHHPHIVQLLAAGEGEGLVWYAMPYVEGESISERLARTGTIPVPDAIRILREVADALSYAHTRGIVHRDIKPPNIMLSGRHALVTDFGVAKALAEGSQPLTRSSAHPPDVTGLTALGMALGTPAYMAPEQAAADPNVDHRADLYSLGIVAYEMLTGELPYDATTPQGLLAAHVTQPPIPILSRRADLPPALAAIVMRCLIKSPADRWSSAAELVEALESVGTPPGGSAAYRAVDVQRTYARWQPARVVATHAAVSAIVVAIAFGLTRALGLPDWVWWAVAIAMGLGLPALLLAARNERRRAHATMTGSLVAVRSGEFTGRRAMLGGVAALSTVALLAGGFAVAGIFGVGPGATLLTKGRLNGTDQLVLAEFQNSTSDSTLTGAVGEALRVDLAQSRAVRLVPTNEVADALTRQGLNRSTRLTTEVARDVAQRLNAKAVLAGEIRPLGSGFVLSGSILDATSGEPLEQVRETAESDKDLIGAVNRLSKSLRERIGESLRAIRSSDALDRVTTASLPALRLYSAANRATESADYLRARDLLEETVKIDTAFAMAWRKLAVVYGNMNTNRQRMMESAQKAYQFRERLTPIERHLAEARYFADVKYDREGSIAAYRAVLALDSTERTSLNNAGLQLTEQGRYAEGEQLLRRGVGSGLWNIYLNLLTPLIAQHKWAAAESVPDLWLKSGGDSTLGVYLKLTGYGMRRQLDRVDSLVGRALRITNATARTRLGFVSAQIAADEYRGHLVLAERLGAEMQKILEQGGDSAAGLGRELIRAERLVVQRSNPAGGWKVVQEALGKYRLDAIRPLDQPYMTLAMLAALTGHAEEAKKWRAARESLDAAGARDPVDVFGWDGLTAMASGNWDSAAAAFRRIREVTPCSPCGQYLEAYALDRGGHADSALVLYGRTIDEPVTGDMTEDPTWYPTALYRAGQLAQERNDRTKALDYLTRFTELWKDADPDLQPKVQDARRRIAELTAEGGKRP